MKIRFVVLFVTALLTSHFFVNCSQSALQVDPPKQKAMSSITPPVVLQEQDPVIEEVVEVPEVPVKNCDLLGELFEDTYYSFFNSQSCNDCHSPQKIPSIPGFAQENVNASFLVFEDLGPQRIEGKIQGGHQGYLYEDHKDLLVDYAESWQIAVEEQQSCEDQGTESIGVVTDDLNPEFHLTENDPLKCGLNFDLKVEKRGWQTLTWDLSKSKASLAGVSFSIDIIVENLDFGVAPDIFYCPTRYRLRNPRLTTAGAEIFIKNVKIKLNGDDQGVATFSWLESTVPANSDKFELDLHGASAPFDNNRFSYSDAWSVEIDQIFDTRL